MKWEWVQALFKRGNKGQPTPERWLQQLNTAYDSLDVQAAVGFIDWVQIAEESDYYIYHENGCPDEMKTRFEELKMRARDRYLAEYREIIPDEYFDENMTHQMAV